MIYDIILSNAIGLICIKVKYLSLGDGYEKKTEKNKETITRYRGK